MTKTIIADNHSLMRDGLRALLMTADNFDVVAMVDNGDDLLSQVQLHLPELIILDTAIRESNGKNTPKLLKKSHPHIKLVVLTFQAEPHHIHSALDAGVDAYVLKDDRRDDLFTAIQHSLEGKTYLSPAIAGGVVNGYLSSFQHSTERDLLTKRERQVIRLVARGMRTKDIAEALSLSPKTIEKHRSSLMRKLELQNASEVTAFAIKNSLLE